MALEVTQAICIVCGDFRITDTTGTYHAVDNPTGYGAPNPEFTDATVYTAEFFPPNSTTSVYTLDLLAPVAAPDADGHYEYNILSSAMGLETLKSGVWKVKITHNTDEKTVEYWADGDIKKRINSCICANGYAKYGQLIADYEAAESSFCCHQSEKAQLQMDQLYRDTANCCGCGCN